MNGKRAKSLWAMFKTQFGRSPKPSEWRKLKRKRHLWKHLPRTKAPYHPKKPAA